MYGLQTIGFFMKFLLLWKVINLHSNGFKQPIVAGEKLETFMKNIVTTNMENEDKEDNMLYKQDSDGRMV
jgi:hypothetical protein